MLTVIVVFVLVFTGVYSEPREKGRPDGSKLVAEASSEKTIIIAVTVTIIAILLAIIAVGGFILYRRSRSQSEIKKVLVQNDMNDPNPGVAKTEPDGRVTLSKLKAHFSKSKLEEDDSTNDVPPSNVDGVTNPVYMDDRNRDIIMEESSIEQPDSNGYDV